MMKKGWKRIELVNFLDFYNGKSIKAGMSGKYKVYGSNGIIGFSENYKYDNAIILGRVGANCGSVEYEKAKFWPSDNTIVVKPKEKGAERFTFYLLNNYPLNRLAGGSAQPLITQTILKKIEMTVPEKLTEQQKIATTLSNYDNLIENNTKRIELLEKISKLIYEEWFMKFRFPGHEKIKFVDSEAGDVPEGWEIKTIGEILDFIKRGSSLKYISNKKGVPVVNQRCVRFGKISLNSIQFAEDLIDTKKDLYLQKKDILVNSMGVGTLGRVGMNMNINEKMIIHNCITVLRVNKKMFSQNILYLNLLNLEQELITLGVGTTGQTSLKPSDIESLKILIPTKEIRDKADILFNKIFELIGIYQNRNQNLSKTRDLLLPRLITGKVDISELDIQVGVEA
jgi:type I restriction enzyme, S subunit